MTTLTPTMNQIMRPPTTTNQVLRTSPFMNTNNTPFQNNTLFQTNNDNTPPRNNSPLIPTTTTLHQEI